MPQAFFLISLASCVFMTGLIWFVQLVHYPMMLSIREDDFDAYRREHMKRTAPVVILPMILHLASSLALLIWPTRGVPEWLLWIGAGLAGITWLSTGLLQVPCYKKLEQEGYSVALLKRLVRTNWVRTIAWTAHSTTLIIYLAQIPYSSTARIVIE